MPNPKLSSGDKAPNFKLPDASGETVSLSDFKGSWLVLYFYPKDNTPGCTIEANDFTKLIKDFAKAGAEVVGVSKDSCASHAKFISNWKLKVRLLSDEDSSMQKDYGVWRKKKFMGREFNGTVRSTFLIDPKGVIREVWDSVSARGHAAAVLRNLKELA